MGREANVYHSYNKPRSSYNRLLLLITYHALLVSLHRQTNKCADMKKKNFITVSTLLIIGAGIAAWFYYGTTTSNPQNYSIGM